MELINNIINLLVGLSIFIVGMNMMSTGLKKVSGHGVKQMFEKTQKNRLVSLLIGLIVTALVQSSSATSIMVIGFINAGIMSVIQGISVMLGAFIGTTATGLIVSLSSFNISIYLTLFAFIGLVLTFFKKEKIKNIGTIFTGFGILFFGLKMVSTSFENDALKNQITSIFTSINFPLLLILAGILFTALLQSCSATISIFIVMVGNNVLSFSSAMFLTIGATLGAMVPIVLSTIGGTINAKRAVAAALINRIGSLILLSPVIWIFESEISSFFNMLPTTELALAIFAIVYNVVSMLITIPFVNKLEKLSQILIKDKESIKKQNYIKYIDDRFLNTPSIAITQVKKEIENMAYLSLENFKLGYEMIVTQNVTKQDELNEREEAIDYINNIITDFLINLSNKLSSEEEKEAGSFFHVVNDIERIGDHASNFLDSTLKMKEDGICFSTTALNEFKEMYDIIIEMFEMSIKAFDKNEVVNLKDIHNLEEKTDELKSELSSKHYERLLKNECKIELSPFYTTFVSELERIADHLTNIGYSVVNPTGDEVIIEKGK